MIDVDAEKKSQDGIDIDDGSNIDQEDNYFQPHNNYASDEEYKNEEDGVVENWEWKPVTDDLEITDIPDNYDVPHGMKAGVDNIIATILG